MLTQQPDRIGARKTLGHLAMHYRTREDGPLAAKLLDLLGFARVPSPRRAIRSITMSSTEPRATMATASCSSWSSRRHCVSSPA